MPISNAPDAPALARLEEIYRANVGRVHGFVHHRVGADALDVVSEVFHAAAIAAREGRVEQVTTAWLMAVARNKVADHWRRTYRARARWTLVAATEEDAVTFPADWHEDPRRPAVVAGRRRLRGPTSGRPGSRARGPCAWP